jgi:hypothetical protein
MFSIVPILLEVFFVLLKPHELYPMLGTFQPLYALPGLIILGFVFDAGRFGVRAGKMAAAPYLWIALGLFVWAMITTAIHAPNTLTPEAILFGTSMVLSLSIAHALQSFRLYQVLAGGLLALTLFLSFVAIDQAKAPTKCFYTTTYAPLENIPTGRPCNKPEECPTLLDEQEGAEERFWKCEHPGIMNTTSVDHRIRFRGYLEDPNELALATAMGLPFAFAFFERKKKFYTAGLALVSFGMVVACVFFSQSRGGMIALGAVLATKFVHRFGFKIGGIAMGIAAVPLAVLMTMTGRSAADAEGSATERTELLQAGIHMVMSYPISGVGKGQFPAREFMTAHNSYVLAAAELGVVGFAIWSMVFYFAVKIPISALRQLKGVETPGAAECRIWAVALLASLVSGMIGSFFLSWTYHNYLWIYVGVAGALFGVVRKELPSFRVRVSSYEVGAVVFANLFLLGAIGGYARYKLGH